MRSLRRYIRAGNKHPEVCAVNSVELASTVIKIPSYPRFYILRIQYDGPEALTRYTKNYNDTYMGFASPAYLYTLGAARIYFSGNRTRIYDASRHKSISGYFINAHIMYAIEKSDYVNTA